MNQPGEQLSQESAPPVAPPVTAISWIIKRSIGASNEGSNLENTI